MNQAHLGDALDHWKGQVLSVLQEKNALQSLGVLAMIVDGSANWTQELQECYAQLVSVDVASISFEDFIPAAGRAAYFEHALPNAIDLFLDPCTGLREGGGRSCVNPKDVESCVDGSRNRVVLIYQHRNRSPSCYDDKVSLVARNGMRCFCCDFGQVGILCVSKNRSRLNSIRKTLSEWLRPDPNGRVGTIR